MWKVAEAVCNLVVFLDMGRMGSLLLKAKGTQKLSLLLTLSVTLSPVVLHCWTRSAPGEVGRSLSWCVVAPVPLLRVTELRVSCLQGYGHGRQTRLAVWGF